MDKKKAVEEEREPPRAKRRKRESEGEVVATGPGRDGHGENRKESRKKEKSVGEVLPPLDPEAEKTEKCKKKADKDVEEEGPEEDVPQAAGEGAELVMDHQVGLSSWYKSLWR